MSRGPEPGSKAAREAAALRDNLRRRKAPAPPPARDPDSDAGEPPPPGR